MKSTIKFHGRKFKLVEKQEAIQAGAIHTLDGERFSPIMNQETIGDVPANFSPDRKFYNPIETEKDKHRKDELKRAYETGQVKEF